MRIHYFDYDIFTRHQGGFVDLSYGCGTDGRWIDVAKYAFDGFAVVLFDDLTNFVKGTCGTFVLQYGHGIDPYGREGVAYVGRAHLTAFDVKSLQFQNFIEASQGGYFVQLVPGGIGTVHEHVVAVVEVGWDG